MNKRLQTVIFFGLWAVKGSLGQKIEEPPLTIQIPGMDPSPDPTTTADITTDLKKEAPSSSGDQVIVTIAPDETCGYLSGRAVLPITCENHRPCMWSPSLGVLCGDLANDNFDIHVRCLDREMVLDQNICNDTCVDNPVYLLCSHKSAPYCGTYAFPNGIQDFRCSSTPATRVSSVYFTYMGQENARFATTTYGGESVSETSTTESTTSSSSTIPPSSSSSSSSSSNPPPSSQNNLGAIIGGAVGGFVALSLVIFGIVWFVRQSRKKSRHSIPVNQMEQDPLSDPNTGKTGPTSPAQSDWRDSTMTALSSPNSASPQAWMNQPVSPSAQSDTSQGMLPTMGQHLAYEMSGESAQPPHEMGDNRVYEMEGDPNRPWV
ncbi:hypothetical protein FPOAC2_04387 [Fusarium poae]|uniref:hypothetical protein n=1 Tax=Fusarium poae TaxID=36050 RepID=UPI001CEB9151|nr:hypothetical protein FPOAC1_004304 [Fusarium poae]KAG8671067.1 hypothetical protein FPOAC1_004304 [Fusarium poae]